MPNYRLASYGRLICWLLMVIIILPTCKQKSKAYVIGFSQCVESDAWRKTMLDEMKRELSFHPDLQLVYRQADGNSQTQISQVKELLERKVDILIVSPNEAGPLTPVVEEVFNAGIPVIVVDRKISSPHFTAYVGGDNYAIGKLAGEYAVNVLGGKGTVLEITGLPKSTPAIERNDGFADALKGYPGIKIDKRLNGEWYKETAKQQLASMLETSGPIDLVFAQNDVMAAGAYEVFKSRGLSIPAIIGVDGLPCEGCGMQLVSDRITTASLLYPTGGEEAIRLAVKILHKEEYAKENKIRTTIIDSANVRLMQLQASKISNQQQSIERQQQMLEEQQTIYKNQQNLLYFLIISLVLAISFGAIAFYSLRLNRRINKQLKQQNAEILDQKKKIEEISARAHEANEAKVTFFTNISHEFRTPLTLILGPLEELLASGKKQHNQAQNLNLIHKNVTRLLKLVNQLIDFRKIDVDKMRVHVSENDLVSFASDIVESYKGVAAKKNIDLRLFTKDRQIDAWFDVNLLDKVIFNVLSNALKFTNTDGYVHLYLYKSDDGLQAVIQVEDNGIGMADDVSLHAFELFYQGDCDNSKGSGLGLALSNELIKLHKGSISVKSKKGKGTTFEILLPLGNEHFEKPDFATMPGDAAARYETEIVDTTEFDTANVTDEETEMLKTDRDYTILLVEDNTELRTFLRNRLQLRYEVVEAHDSQSALKEAFDSVPDLIITDVVIPGKDGLTLTSIIKTDIRTSHIPIILLTGKANISHQIEGMKNRADVYITKPFNIQFLEHTIQSLLANREILKEHFTSELPSNLKTRTVGKEDKKFMNEFTSLVESNLSNEDFNVEGICKTLGVSRVQLYRRVNALLNKNVNDYILDTRLQKAKYLLHHEQTTISDIAYKVGFSSPAYFSTVFKSRFGVTPKAFKEK